MTVETLEQGIEEQATTQREYPSEFKDVQGKRTANLIPYKPGHSGNPAGKPKKNKDLVTECRNFTPTILRRLKNICKSSPVEKNAIAAANTLLAYGWGKPSTKLIIETPGQSSEELLELATPDELRQIFEIRQSLNSRKALADQANTVDADFTPLDDDSVLESDSEVSDD